MADETAVVAQSDATETTVSAEETKAVEINESDANDPQAKPEGEPENDEQRHKRLGGWQRKIQRQEQEIEYWRNAALGAAKPAPVETPEKPAEAKPKPKMDAFESMEAYLDARDAWVEENATKKALETIESKSKAETQKSEKQKADEQWQEKLSTFRKEHSDFDEVLAEAVEARVPCSEAMSQVLHDSDIGADLLYYLATHPEEATRLAPLSPLAAAREMGKIESRLSQTETPAKEVVSTPAPTPQTQAPAPPTPVRKPSSVQSVDLNDPNTPTDRWLKEYRKKMGY